jgi:hypothetical protein
LAGDAHDASVRSRVCFMILLRFVWVIGSELNDSWVLVLGRRSVER